MRRRSSRVREGFPALTTAVVLIVIQVSVATAQFASTEPARKLAYFFERTGRHAVAAVDSDDGGAFVAALYVAGDLLVIRARHPSVLEVTRLIESRRFVDVYSRLRATPTPAGKLSVTDANANGLLSAIPGGENIDLVRIDGTRQIMFNGDIDGQNMTAAQYDAALAEADSRYARLLTVLLSAVEP
jgi:hypothetical protein